MPPLTRSQLREIARQALSGATGRFWAELEPEWKAEVERWSEAQAAVILPPPHLAGRFIADQVAAGRLPASALREDRGLQPPPPIRRVPSR